jgi:hypothetical protein
VLTTVPYSYADCQPAATAGTLQAFTGITLPLTPWNRVPLDKRIVAELVDIYPACY